MAAKRKGKPHVNAILLADGVYRDEDSGKFVIAGTFNQVNAGAFPIVHTGSWLYLNLSDFKGDHELGFRLVRLSDGRELARSPDAAVSSKDTLRHMEIRAALPPLVFDGVGQYAIEVLWNGDYLAACKITVAKKK